MARDGPGTQVRGFILILVLLHYFVLFYFCCQHCVFLGLEHVLEGQTLMTTNGHVTASTHQNGGNSSNKNDGSSSGGRGSRRVSASSPRQVHFYLYFFYLTNSFFYD